MNVARLNPVERARRDVCHHAKRFRSSLAGGDLLARAMAKDALLNALNHLDAMEARARAGLWRGRGSKRRWRQVS